MGGGGCCGPDVRSPPGGERRGVSSTRHPRRPSSFMSLPSPSQPGPAAAARSPPPASLPAVFRVGPRSWGTAARLGGEGRVPPQRPETGRGPGAGGGVLRCGGAGRRGRGWSAPPPLPQRIWPGQLRGADPRSKPPPGFKGRPAGGAGGGAAGSTLRASPLSQHPGPLSRGETPPSKLASGFLHSCSHPPTQGPVVVTVPPSQTPSVSPI